MRRSSLAHHVIGVDGQQQLHLLGVKVEVGPESVAGPDGTALKHLSAYMFGQR